MNNFEKSILVLSMNGLFLLGAYALRPYSWLLAVVVPALEYFLFYIVHRIRICNFCRQDCPYRPAKPDPRWTQVGFSPFESVLFFGIFGLLALLDLVAIFLFNIIAGSVIVLMLIYVGFVYRRKICIQCDLPCPVSPKRKESID